MLHNRLRPGNPEKPYPGVPAVQRVFAFPEPQGKTDDPEIPAEIRKRCGAEVQTGQSERGTESAVVGNCQFVRTYERCQRGVR